MEMSAQNGDLHARESLSDIFVSDVLLEPIPTSVLATTPPGDS